MTGRTSSGGAAATLTAIVHEVDADHTRSLHRMVVAAHEVAVPGAQLIAFAETASTGFVATDDPVQARLVAEPVPGPTTQALAVAAHELDTWIVAGLYEMVPTSHGPELYDSAVLLAPSGALALHYRRITAQWHGPEADPAGYRQGDSIPVANTPFGRTAIILCGDLFDEAVGARIAELDLDVLIVPIVRGFDTDVVDSTAWRSAERLVYADRARALGAGWTVIVNLLDPRPAEPAFGGALIVDSRGAIQAELDIEAAGAVSLDIARPAS